MRVPGLIDVFAVAYERTNEMRVFVQSWINQSADNWRLTVIHDGPSTEFEKAMRPLAKQMPKKIKYFCTESRFNDYGHSLRQIGIEQATGDYLLLTNADNYFNRGAFLMDIKYYQDGNTDLTKSLRLNNNNSFAHFYRGASNLFLGKFIDAISDFSEAIKFDSMDFDAYLGLAMAHLKVNDTTRAKLNFNKANAILIPSKKLSTIEQYNNTYWFHNQYFYFNNSINALVNLK